jgi:hypothetical protein
MKTLLLMAAMLAGQAMPLQDKPVVRLRPNTDTIPKDFGGSMVQLIQPPAVVYLPTPPPKPDADGNQWTVDVKNFGPQAVTIVDKANFSVSAAVNQTLHIVSNGRTYILKH